MSRQQLSRRTFLAASAVFAAPLIIPARAFGANERIVTAHIGIGGQGSGNLKAFMGQGVAPAAIVDVDSKRLASTIKMVSEKGFKVDGYDDYRKVLERKDIDAIVVSTPDHWHALPTVHGCQAGKDVYCEKPLTLTIPEGRAMVEAARAHNRIVQTGSQQRSDAKFRKACELVRNGKIGKVNKVLVGLAKSNFGGPPVADSEPPAELNYDMWLGPAPQRPYNQKRVHYNFRFFWDYSGGQMTNWGAHHIDIAHWALGFDHTGPVSTEGTAEFHPEKWFEVSTACRITHKYGNGVEIVVGQEQKDIPGGTTFIGEKGTIFVNRGVLRGTPAELIEQELSSGDESLYVSSNHHKNFLDCIKSRELPICDVEIGHRTASACHLGNIAIRLGRKIEWDPVNEKIVGNDPEAIALVNRPYRAPWSLK
ncbi:oxidoreductase domain protein [Planctopirus limnophila DSM 3776]|uniref:Oxidoreductase domain protein n=1 Tax=Planctopirus limnophila (strain ATCC 43296 / DSM 3776 / IFAM 1008 / Mu 290) TaxID=521674 RepID=D5SV37_PLAL2|nr:Gfo/Idh/MocA family oxidoreductase [Planctopirus limnophila]ADG69323.1 oxidoreductase domain protein [Planctopirus limnophila DSM 3776]